MSAAIIRGLEKKPGAFEDSRTWISPSRNGLVEPLELGSAVQLERRPVAHQEQDEKDGFTFIRANPAGAVFADTVR